MSKKLLKWVAPVFCALLTCLYTISPAFPQNYDPDNPEAVVRKYFQCIRDGDLSTLQALMGGELSKKRAETMRDSRYSDFLREYFRGAVLQSVLIEPIDNNITYAELQICQGKNLSFVLLKMSRKNHSWLVTEELGR